MKIRRFVTGAILAVAAVTSGALLAQAPQAVGTWAPVRDLQAPLPNGASVALSDGRTLIVGGMGSNGTLSDSVIAYDAVNDSVTAAGVLVTPRSAHTATLLQDGRVLIVGGVTEGGLISSDIEIFDPTVGTSMIVAQLAEPRRGHVAASLPDGTVLIAGGATTDGVVLQTAVIFDPETDSLSPLSTMLQIPRVNASATTLLDGQVLIAGGSDGAVDLSSAEIYDRYSRSFAMTQTHMSVARQGHSAVLLQHNGGVLIVGGTPDVGTDLFLPAVFPDPYSYGEGAFAPTGAMAASRATAVAGPTSAEGFAYAASAGAHDAEVYRFATIKTDKDDYVPGEFAVITGSGWQPNEEVTLLFQEDPAVHDDYVLKVNADPAGNIFWNQWAPEHHDFGVRFYLTAAGSQSRAQTTFTDGKLFTSTITPTSTAAGVPTAYTVTVTNTSAGSPSGAIGCVQIAIPTGVTNIVSLSGTATDPGGLNRSSGWSAPTVSGGIIDTRRSVNGTGSGDFDIDPNGTIVISFTATSTGGTKVWTTSAAGNQNCGDPFAISGSQPSVTVTGTKATPTISFAAAPTPTFGAGNFAVAATTTNTDSSALTYSVVSGPCTVVSGSTFSSSGAGACVVQASGAETANFNAVSNTQSVTIAKAEASIVVNGYTGIYDSQAHGATGSATGVGGVVLSGLDLGTSFTDVPGGTAHWSFTDATGNYNNASGDVPIVISKADATVTVTGYTGVYDAQAHGATGGAHGVGGVDLSAGLNLGATFTDVPGGTAHWTFAGGTNYNDQSGDVAIVISKADATVSVTGYTGVYDAQAHGATGSAHGVGGVDLSAGLNLGATFTDVPGGTAHWTFAGGTNYNDQSGDVAIVISKADATVSVTGYTGVYDAQAHGAAGSAHGVGGAALSGLDLGATFTDVPGGTAHWTFTGGTNYNDQSGDVAIVISKADATVIVNGYTGVYDAQAHGATGSAHGIGGVALSGLNLGASFTNVPGGTANWTFTDATGNYNDASGTAAIVISKADATVTVNGYTGVYDGQAHGATGSATGVGGVALSGLNLGASFTNAPGGTASWTFTDATGNYNNASGTAAIVIGKANATVTVTGYSVTFDAQPHTATATVAGVNGEILSASLVDLSGTTHTAVGTYDNDPWSFQGTGNYNASSGTVKDAIGAWSLKGFYQPVGETSSIVSQPGVQPAVSAATVWNAIKGGQTVPLKFNIYRSVGGAQVTTVADAFSGAGFGAYQLPNCSGGYTDDEIPLNDLSTGATELRWDGTQFIQNWKTPKVAGADLCFRAVITAKDGSTITAFFKVKK